MPEERLDGLLRAGDVRCIVGSRRRRRLGRANPRGPPPPSPSEPPGPTEAAGDAPGTDAFGHRRTARRPLAALSTALSSRLSLLLFSGDSHARDRFSSLADGAGGGGGGSANSSGLPLHTTHARADATTDAARPLLARRLSKPQALARHRWRSRVLTLSYRRTEKSLPQKRRGSSSRLPRRGTRAQPTFPST